MKEKLIASFLAALTVFSPAAFAALSGYPDNLAAAGVLDAYIAVGAAAATDDVVGAINLAIRLEEVSKTSTTISCEGAAAGTVTGLDKELNYGSARVNGGAVAGTDTTYQLPNEVKTFHYSGLDRGEVNYRGTDYSYSEIVVLSTTAGDLGLTNKKGAPVNGTIRMKVKADTIVYKWTLDENISSSYIHNFTEGDPNYNNPFIIDLLGQEFQIVATPTTSSVQMLAGTVGDAYPDTTNVESGGYSVYCTDAADGSWAVLIIKDATGAIVASDTVTQGNTWTNIDLGGTDYELKLLTAYASTATSKVHAKVTFGTDVDKKYDGGSDSKFPGYDDWRISAEVAGPGAGYLGKYTNITVKYHPSETQYLELGEKIVAPNDYFEVSARDFNTEQFADVTFAPTSGITSYSSTATTADSETGTGLLISTDVDGTIGSYDKIAVLYNDSHAWIAYYDPTSTKYLWDTSVCSACSAPTTEPIAKNFNLQYAGSGEVTFKLEIDAQKNSTDTTSSATGLASVINITISNSTFLEPVKLDFVNETEVTSSDTPSLGLGANEGTAESSDVKAPLDGTGNVGVGTMSVDDIVTDTGLIIKVPNTYAPSDQVVVRIPSKVLRVKVMLGKLATGTATEGECVQETLTPVTSAIALLDSEVTATHKAKNMILVGGPCVNTLVADLAAAGLFDYTCDSWPARNFGLIEEVADAFTTGKSALVVAGTRAEDTKTACSVLQQYDTLLADQTGLKVEVTSATSAGITAV
jgi:hypothetical protein